jgi:hypothetical protein
MSKPGKPFQFEVIETEQHYDDIEPTKVLCRLVATEDGWIISWNKQYLERLKTDDEELQLAYRMVESVKDSLARMLGVQ